MLRLQGSESVRLFVAKMPCTKFRMCKRSIRIVAPFNSCKTCATRNVFFGHFVLIWLAITFCITATVVAIFQRVYVVLFEMRTRYQLKQPVDEPYLPKTAVVLCLRGADPSLMGCLRSIENQDFVDFQLHVVVDDLSDPALEVVREFQVTSEVGITIHLIEDRGEHCSLKCSAIRTAILAIDDDREVIALIDADAIVTPAWLRTLVLPLGNHEVGASTGNRWFRISNDHRFGSAVRGVWNAAAVVQMYLYEIPWGGSLALRREVIDKTNLLDHWSRGFCEDTMLTRILHREGYQIARPVELIVVNEESTTAAGAFRWIQRQLLTVRLHHPRWIWIWLHGLTTALPLAGVFLALVCWLTNANIAAVTTLMGLFLFELAAVYTMLAIVKAHQPLLDRSRQDRSDSKEYWCYLLAVPITQVIHFAATLGVSTLRRISWRKIEYSVGSKKIRMLKYSPFVADNDKESESIE